MIQIKTGSHEKYNFFMRVNRYVDFICKKIPFNHLTIERYVHSTCHLFYK
ncbi:hypothetical protein B4065_1425 [Caldibacillus thermoamylovorans]|nr:hypothetical protein B4065_1425 [Caldibacillus thermoamylovorans]